MYHSLQNLAFFNICRTTTFKKNQHIQHTPQHVKKSEALKDFIKLQI